jgi:preprotein translocase subunit SecG
MSIITSFIMGIINMFLTGLMWIMAAALIISIIALALMVTWMQVSEERKESHVREEEASTKESICPAPAAQRRRRRVIKGYAA